MRLFLLTCLIGLNSWVFAQPSTTDFPNFTYNDIEGNPHDLYGYLDAGKTVIVDVFATWCPLCINSVPGLETIWEEHGPGGDNTMMVLSFERDPNTTNEASWAVTHGVTSPIITGAETVISDVWNISYQPRYFVICPDRTWQLHSGAINSDSSILTDLAANCAPPVSIEQPSLQDLHLTTTSHQLVVHGAPSAQLHLVALNGQVLQHVTAESGRQTLDISGLKPGVYLLRATSGTEVRVLRFVKA